MMTDYAVWHGTKEELQRLQEAAARNCECKPPGVSYPSATRTPGTMCEAHKMLLDQKVLDHLAFVAEQRARYVEAEPDAG
jgi:hypothetical protein